MTYILPFFQDKVNYHFLQFLQFWCDSQILFSEKNDPEEWQYVQLGSFLGGPRLENSNINTF